MADLPVKKTEKQRMRPVRSTRLRKLLPKPPCKDPPDIVHVKILPQQLLEKEDKDDDKDSLSEDQDCKNSGHCLSEELLNISCKEQLENIAEEEIPVENQDGSLENNILVNINEGEKEKSTIPEETVQETSTKDANLGEKISKEKTPKPPLIKKNISRSTPRRNSHVRALSFNTPHKPVLGRKANTSPKMPKIRFSPHSSKFDHVKRSSLFKSPPSPKKSRKLLCLMEEDEGDESEDDSSGQVLVTSSPLANVPIATRSPAPKLSTAWKEVNDVTITEELIDNTEKPKRTTKKPVKVIEKPASGLCKPQWDDKIRSFVCGDFVDPVPPPKKQFKEKPKEKYAVKKSEVKSKTNDSSIRRSTRLSNNAGSPLKDPLKSNNTSKRKTSPQKVKNKTISHLSQTVVNKPPNKFSSKLVSKMNKKIITPETVMSSTDDSSSSICEDVSVTTNLNKDITNSKHNNIVETKISSPNCQNNQSEKSNCQEVINAASLNNSNITSSILLEDLVLSSNSCFPLAVEEISKEQLIGDITDTNQIKETHGLTGNIKPNNDSNKKSVSPKFALPFIPMQETPLKDMQAVFPATPVLNTPYIKNIVQETSVLEEDLLLTPSLPPTPQVVSPRYLGRTPSKCIEALETVAVVEIQNSSKKVKKNNVCSLIGGTENQIQTGCTSKTSNFTMSDQKSIRDSSSDNIVNCPDNFNTKLTRNNFVEPSSQNKSSRISKDNLTTSSESSDEEIMRSFLNRPTKNQHTLKPTIKTRIIQGPVNAKPKGYINNRKIYTTSDSSDEENNDNNVNKIKINKHQESNQRLSNLRSMLIEEERNRIERLSKNDNLNKKQKTHNKVKSKLKNKSSPKHYSGSFKSTKPKEETNKPLQLNISSKNEKTFSPKEKSSIENNGKTILTPEKIREQLENDLLLKERQHIFGDNLQLSSDSESELEVFEKKKQISKPKNSVQARTNLSFKNRKITVSDESSSDEVYKSNASSSNEAANKDKIMSFDKNDFSVPKSSLPRAPTPCFLKSLPQQDNSSTMTDHEVSNVNEIDKSEAHISVISSDNTKKSIKNVSLNVPVFDPHIQIGFETDNGTIKLSYSKTIFHIEMLNTIDQDISKRNIPLQSLKTRSQKPSKGIDGKRRVKPTPVEEGKYEKLKVDYDIVDGKVISKRKERQTSNEADILDCTCSTIDADSTVDSTTKNQIVSVNRFDFKGTMLNLQESRKKYEKTGGRIETTIDCKETKNLPQSSLGGTSQTSYKTNEKDSIPLFVKPTSKQSETIEHNLTSTKLSELSIGLKEIKLKRKNSVEPVKQSDKKPEYKDKHSKTQLDKRKEVELRDRRREGDFPERSVRKDQSRRYMSRREDDRRRYSERRRHHQSPEHYRRSHLDRKRDSRNYYARTPPYEDYDKGFKYSNRRRESKGFSKPSTHWKDMDSVKEQVNKNDSEEESNEVFDPRAEQQLSSYSDVEKHSSDGADSLMDFAVLNKRKRLPNSSQSSPFKESLVRNGQSLKRKTTSSGEDVSETSKANKKLKMEEKDMREAKSVLKHKMADMLNALHPDTSNEAS